MYVSPNFKSRVELERAIAAGGHVTAFQPGPFGPTVADGEHCAEGPHYPMPHRWYGTVEVKSGVVVGVKDKRGKWVRLPEKEPSSGDVRGSGMRPVEGKGVVS